MGWQTGRRRCLASARRGEVRAPEGTRHRLPRPARGARGAVRRRCSAQLPPRVRRAGGRDRLAAGRRRHVVRLPLRPSVPARRPHRRPPGERLRRAPARVRGRPDGRERARGRRCDHPHPPARQAGVAALDGERRGVHASRDRRGCRGQRDDGGALPPARRRDHDRCDSHHLAHVVARRCVRRSGRRAAGSGLVDAASESGWEVARARSGAAPRHRHRRVRARDAQPPTAGVPRLSAADLGCPAVRAARRHPRGRARRRPDGVEHHPLRRPVRLRVHLAQRPQHAALHRRRRALVAVPRRGRLGEGGVRRGPRRVAGAACRRCRHRAAPTRRGAGSIATSTTARSSG